MIAHNLPVRKLLYDEVVYHSGLDWYNCASLLYRINATMEHTTPGIP